ncbi:unnamed protein product, partial [Iphiclides podalirius]
MIHECCLHVLKIRSSKGSVDMEEIKKFLQFESPHFPVVRKCCFCVSLLRSAVIYAYVSLVLAVVSIPGLILLLVEARTTGEISSVPITMEPKIQLPLNVALIAIDVVLTVMLLIGVQKKRKELLQIYFFAGVIYNFLAICLAVIYFDSNDYFHYIVDASVIIFNLYMLFVIYNAVYVLVEEAARAAEVQYVTYLDRQCL